MAGGARATTCWPTTSSTTRWKGEHFPIAGLRGPQATDCRTLGHECPLLIYPLGDFDDDPEALIAFVGPLPVPRLAAGEGADRARVTIDLLGLALREELLEERSRHLHGLWIALTSLEGMPAQPLRDAAERAVRLFTAPQSPHCSCARSYVALYRSDPIAAQQIAQAALRYLESLGS